MDCTSRSRHLLASDNASGVHPDVMHRLATANALGHALGYGADEHSAQAQTIFKDQFGQHTETFFVATGTGANVLALQGMMRSHELVYCCDSSHLWNDECAAPEHHLGCKLVPLPTEDGKLKPAHLEAAISTSRGNVHRAQPRVVSVSQATERGTVYLPSELYAISEAAHAHGLLLHMDGARLANAAAALGVALSRLTTDVGVDVLSFGGTKNGLMMAEALVVLNPQLLAAYPFIRKQGMQLLSKQRYVAAQYLAYFEDELWRRSANNANAMARYLAQRLAGFEAVTLSAPVETNLVFAQLPSAWVDALQRVTGFLTWPGDRITEARFVTSWDTRPHDIDVFIAALSDIAHTTRKGSR